MVLRNAGEIYRLDKCIMNGGDVDALRGVTWCDKKIIRPIVECKLM